MTHTPIRALDSAGNEYWYTGKAGQTFVSPRFIDAFLGYNLDGARSKAMQLNRMTEIHGLRFVAVSPEPVFVDTCIEHGPGGTLRLPFQIRVF